LLSLGSLCFFEGGFQLGVRKGDTAVYYTKLSRGGKEDKSRGGVYNKQIKSGPRFAKQKKIRKYSHRASFTSSSGSPVEVPKKFIFSNVS